MSKFKAGDVVVAKEGMARSATSARFNVVETVQYVVADSNDSGITLVGSGGRYSDDRFELAPKTEYRVLYRGALSAMSYLTAQSAVDYAAASLRTGTEFSVVRLSERKAYKLETHAVAA